jgi:hypothetical protein
MAPEQGRDCRCSGKLEKVYCRRSREREGRTQKHETRSRGPGPGSPCTSCMQCRLNGWGIREENMAKSVLSKQQSALVHGMKEDEGKLF